MKKGLNDFKIIKTTNKYEQEKFILMYKNNFIFHVHFEEARVFYRFYKAKENANIDFSW